MQTDMGALNTSQTKIPQNNAKTLQNGEKFN
jgi:hypothetical protein